jgi:hypothetical protein
MVTHGGSSTRVISSSDIFVQRAIFRQTSPASFNPFSITVPSLYSHKIDKVASSYAHAWLNIRRRLKGFLALDRIRHKLALLLLPTSEFD